MRLMALIFILLLFVAAQAFVTWRVWLLLPVPLWLKIVAATALTACLCLFFVALSPKLDTMPMWQATLVYEVGTSYVIVLLYLILLFAAMMLGRMMHVCPRELIHDSYTGSFIVVTVITALLYFGNRHYQNKYCERLELLTAKPMRRPVRMVMASDLHLGYHNDRAELARWVDTINAQKPDVVFFAGDLIDRSIRPLIETGMAEELRRIQAPVFACLGNHEYFAGLEAAVNFYREAGIRLLRDEAVAWDNMLIVGRDDRANPRRKSLGELIGKDEKRYVVVLDHQPYDLETSEQCGVDFQLSGHTHYGQVWPASWLTRLIYECPWGRHTRGKTQYYITSGLGIWGGKFRVGTRSEFIVADLCSRE